MKPEHECTVQEVIEKALNDYPTGALQRVWVSSHPSSEGARTRLRAGLSASARVRRTTRHRAMGALPDRRGLRVPTPRAP